MKSNIEMWRALMEAKESGDDENYNLLAGALASRGSSLFESLLSYFTGESTREIALEIVARMGEKPRKALLWKLAYTGLSHRNTGVYWRFVEALPRDWVAEHIEETVRPLLKDENDDDAYRQITSLLSIVNPELYKKVVLDGTQSPNEHIRECALDLLADR